MKKGSPRGEKTMILKYQGNTLAIAKEMQKQMLGIEKMMMFILGYGQSASYIFCCYLTTATST